MNTYSYKLVNRSIWYLFFYALWGFIFSHSIISNSLYVYASFLSLGTAFTLILSRTSINLSGIILWLPYMIYTALGYFANDNIEVSIYWYIAIVLLITAKNIDYNVFLPKKLLTISGFICITGICLQFLMKPLYYIIAAFIFSLNEMSSIQIWDFSGYGYAGFTYQLAMTAIILLYAECVWLFKHKYDSTQTIQVYLHWAIALAFIISIFLTGKRMMSFVSIVAPFIAYVFTTGRLTKFIGISMIGLLTGFLGYSYVESNAVELSNSPLIGRFARTIVDQQNGEDFSSGREELRDAAYRVFNSSPVVGVGCGKFIEKSGEDSDVHNSYLQILSEQGIVGIVLFIIPLALFLLRTIKMAKILSQTADDDHIKITLFIQIAFIAYAFTGNVTINFFGFMIYYYSIAMLISLKSKYNL